MLMLLFSVVAVVDLIFCSCCCSFSLVIIVVVVVVVVVVVAVIDVIVVVVVVVVIVVVVDVIVVVVAVVASTTTLVVFTESTYELTVQLHPCLLAVVPKVTGEPPTMSRLHTVTIWFCRNQSSIQTCRGRVRHLFVLTQTTHFFAIVHGPVVSAVM